jgi:hypothetical protein
VTPNWQHQPLSQQAWRDQCLASSHVRPGDTLSFSEPDHLGVITCFIAGTSVYLGTYFTRGDKGNVLAGTGWNHT